MESKLSKRFHFQFGACVQGGAGGLIHGWVEIDFDVPQVCPANQPIQPYSQLPKQSLAISGMTSSKVNTTMYQTTSPILYRNYTPYIVRVVLHACDGNGVHANAVQLLRRRGHGPAHKLPCALELRREQ